MKLPKIKGSIDYSLFVIPFLLTITGIAVLFSISPGSKFILPINQMVYFVLGAGIALLFTIIDYRELKTIAVYLYIISLVLLVFLHFFGQEIFGATRWIDIKVFQLQPSELMKMALLIIASSVLSMDFNDSPNPKKNLLILLYFLVPVIFILQQPDLGTTLIIIFFLSAMYIFSNIKLKYFVVFLLVISLLVPMGWHFLKPYQRLRITTFLDSGKDPLGSGYNATQSKIAVGSGEIMGKGFGNATQSQLNFLPVVHTDFIFASWSESTGFAGSTFMVLLYCILIWRILVISRHSKDLFGSYLAIGIASIFFFQALVNIGMNVGVLPVTGIPLPFVSYGGTSYLVSSAIIGIAQSINLRSQTIKFA